MSAPPPSGPIYVYAIGTWGSIANALLTASALFSDLLIIRACLFLGFVFLLIFGAMGLPDPPYWGPTLLVAWGHILWAGLNILLHGYSLFGLIWDERPISFENEDDEQLFRFFYRRCGMGRLEFKHVLSQGEWRRYKPAERIYAAVKDEVGIYLMVEGVGEVNSCSARQKQLPFLSGEWFDLAVGNVFGIYIGTGIERGDLNVTAGTECLIYFWPLDSVNFMATKSPPAVAAYWRLFLLSTLGSFLVRRVLNRDECDSLTNRALGGPETELWLSGARSLDMTEHLRKEELPKKGVKEFFLFFWHHFHFAMPPGVRHTALPPAGQVIRAQQLAHGKCMNDRRGVQQKSTASPEHVVVSGL